MKVSHCERELRDINCILIKRYTRLVVLAYTSMLKECTTRSSLLHNKIGSSRNRSVRMHRTPSLITFGTVIKEMQIDR